MKKTSKKTLYECVAERHGTTPAEVRAEIQLAIDAAWADPAGREVQQQLFPNGKPTPEEFIRTLAAQARHDTKKTPAN